MLNSTILKMTIRAQRCADKNLHSPCFLYTGTTYLLLISHFMNFDKINWKATLLTIWVVFSFLYISWNMYENFKMSVMQNAYVAGQNDTVAKLIEQASNKECKSFNVYAGDKKVDLVNVACLQQASKESNIPSSPVTPQK